MANKEKIRKPKEPKKDFRILSNVRCVCGCDRYLKQNVIDRQPAARNCYLSALRKRKKTHFFAGTVEVKGSGRRKVFKPIEPVLEALWKRAKQTKHEK